MPNQSYLYIPIDGEPGASYSLNGDQYHYIVNVLRMAENEPLDVVNGSGLIIHSTILEITKKNLKCEIREVVPASNEIPIEVTLAVGVVKQQRFEWMVEKATELGVREIQPLLTDRVVRKALRTDRLKKKAVAAMQQSERAFLPVIKEPVDLSEYLSDISAENAVIAAQELDNASILHLLNHSAFEKIVIFIGPEGGWSQAEIGCFSEKGIRSIRLSKRRLRTETAAVAAMSQLVAATELSKETN